jgi:NADH-quinone oxidoreductase subunit C
MNELLTALLPDENLEFAEHVGQQFVIVQPASVLRVLATLKDSLRFDFLVDLTAVDYPKLPLRFELIYILYSFQSNQRFRVKTRIADQFQPQSAAFLYKAANWLEREVYDMFGIVFSGHPNLKRILMPEEWVGFPLRKDYSIIHQDQAWVQENLGIESGQ